MRKKKKTVTTIEAHQFFVIRRPEPKEATWCVACLAEQSLMVTSDEAARIAGISQRELYRRIEAGTIHYTEPREDLLLICINSLSESPTLITLPGTGEQS